MARLSKAHYHAETMLVRQVARRSNVAYSFSRHADEEMAKDGIADVDIRNIARSGNVTGIEFMWGAPRLTLMGVDHDGDVIAAVVVVNEEISRINVITAWRRDRRRVARR